MRFEANTLEELRAEIVNYLRQRVSYQKHIAREHAKSDRAKNATDARVFALATAADAIETAEIKKRG